MIWLPIWPVNHESTTFQFNVQFDSKNIDIVYLVLNLHYMQQEHPSNLGVKVHHVEWNHWSIQLSHALLASHDPQHPQWSSASAFYKLAWTCVSMVPLSTTKLHSQLTSKDSWKSLWPIIFVQPNTISEEPIALITCAC